MKRQRAESFYEFLDAAAQFTRYHCEHLEIVRQRHAETQRERERDRQTERERVHSDKVIIEPVCPNRVSTAMTVSLCCVL